MMVAAGVLAAGMAVAVLRPAVGSEPRVPEVASTAVPTTVASPSTTRVPDETALVVGEADLMAVDPVAMERTAAAVAAAAVAEYFTADTSGFWAGVSIEPTVTTFVESTRAVTVDRTGPGTFRVVVAVSLLDGTDGAEFRRRPLFGVSIPIDATGGMIRPSDLPAPSPLPIDGFVPPAGVETTPRPEMVAAATAAVAPMAAFQPELVSYQILADGTTRIVLAVSDETGSVWPMSLIVAADGSVVSPG